MSIWGVLEAIGQIILLVSLPIAFLYAVARDNDPFKKGKDKK